MTHHLVKSGYAALVDRINLYPQGAPPSATLYKILKILFNENDASRVSRLPIKPFTKEKAARIWKIKPSEAQKILEDLADRAMAAILGVILKLPPAKQAMASRQMKSRYLDNLVRWMTPKENRPPST